MQDAILVLNAGSSSLKLALFGRPEGAGDPELLLRGQIEGIGRDPRFRLADGCRLAVDRLPDPTAVAEVADHRSGLRLLFGWLGASDDDGRGVGDPIRLLAAGHRVVHGGTRHTAPQRVSPSLLDELGTLIPLAPHHQPHNLAAIEALAQLLPELPQVACFDTAFHAAQPWQATAYGLPWDLHERGLRRYGFHGLSFEYVTGALPAATGAALPKRLAIAHLGNGASLCAVHEGHSVATTMGFSTLDGLVMGTRCGALDPGLILHLMQEDGLGQAELTELLYNRSGLLGLSGVSADMRTLLASPEPGARRAVEIFCTRIVRELGSLAAAMGGLDALVFTGGIGEHAPEVRARVCQGADWLGLAFDEASNAAGGPRLSTPDSRMDAWVVPTNEELVIARHCQALLV